MSRVDVIGANGYIGRHVVKCLYEQGHDVFLYDRGPSSTDGFENYFAMDLRDFETFPDQLEHCGIVFFLAGLTGTSIGREANLDFVEVNEVGLLNLLEFCREKDLHTKIVFPSSRLVYQGKKDAPLKEEDKKEFKTIYAVTKFACEQYLKIYHRLFDIPYTVFRICVPYGNQIDRTLSYGTLNHFLSKAGKGEPLVIYGEGDQKRSFIHIQDLSSILVQGGLDSRTDNDVFNIAGPDVLSIREVAEKIAAVYGVSVKSIPWPEISKKIESGDTIFDSSRLDEILHYQYEFCFDSWLAGLPRQE